MTTVMHAAADGTPTFHEPPEPGIVRARRDTPAVALRALAHAWEEDGKAAPAYPRVLRVLADAFEQDGRVAFIPLARIAREARIGSRYGDEKSGPTVEDVMRWLTDEGIIERAPVARARRQPLGYRLGIDFYPVEKTTMAA